jgi:RNase P/RNase MRP subunit p30
MKKYIDLHITADPKLWNLIINHASELGFDAIGLTGWYLSENRAIDVISRIDLTPRNQEQLNIQLMNARRIYEIISVICLSKNIARQASKDSRVDIIKFPKEPNVRKKVWLDNHQANLMRDSGSGYEIDVNELLSHEMLTIEHRLRQLNRELHMAIKYDLPIIASSGAPDFKMMREPKAIISLLRLLDMNENGAFQMVSNNPLSMIQKNRKKLSKSYVAQGVWFDRQTTS